MTSFFDEMNGANGTSASSHVSQHEPVFQISVVSRMVGIHQQTIRSYERVGLLNPARSSGNTRLFSPADVDRLRQVVRRLALRAGVPEPALHSFRRGYALAMLRAGCDVVTLSRLLGHSDLSLLRRYTKQTGEDLRAAAERHSPGDRL